MLQTHGKYPDFLKRTLDPIPRLSTHEIMGTSNMPNEGDIGIIEEMVASGILV